MKRIIIFLAPLLILALVTCSQKTSRPALAGKVPAKPANATSFTLNHPLKEVQKETFKALKDLGYSIKKKGASYATAHLDEQLSNLERSAGHVSRIHTMKVWFDPVSEKEIIVSLEDQFILATKQGKLLFRRGEKWEKKVRAAVKEHFKK